MEFDLMVERDDVYPNLIWIKQDDRFIGCVTEPCLVNLGIKLGDEPKPFRLVI